MSDSFRRLVTLKPYDHHLADGVVEIWLVFVRLSIVAIALCDALAWSYLGYVTATGAAAYLVAVVAGVIAFTLVGSLDASFVMSDATTQAAKPVDDPKTAGRSRVQRVTTWLQRNVRKNHLAVIARVSLVALTFLVTAPALTLFFFSEDIDAAISRANEQTEANKRSSIEKEYDAKLQTSRTQLAKRMQDLETEISGTGRSRRYGPGPTSEAIRRDVVQLETLISNSEAAKKKELAEFDAATPVERAKRWGVDLQREGPETRARAVAELESSPSFRNMRNNIKWFLGFMFLSLMTLKLFQPKAVKHYYSDELQAAYANYRAGTYNNSRLPRGLHPDRGMTPSQFVRWYRAHQQGVDDSAAVRERLARAAEIYEAQRLTVEMLVGPMAERVTKMNADYEASSQRKLQLEQQLAEATHRQSTLNEKVRSDERELEDCKYDTRLTGDMSLRDRSQYMTMVAELMNQKQRIERQLENNKTSLVHVKEEIGRIRQQITDRETQHKFMSEAIDAHREQARQIQKLLDDANLGLINNIHPPE